MGKVYVTRELPAGGLTAWQSIRWMSIPKIAPCPEKN